MAEAFYYSVRGSTHESLLGLKLFLRCQLHDAIILNVICYYNLVTHKDSWFLLAAK